METLIEIAIGIGLSAACGFRVFMPLLVMNLAALSGQLHLSPDFLWLGTQSATVAFGTATVLEILAYYIPWVDHMMDTVTTPAAVIAGAVATASTVTDVSPFLRWTLALIAGGGIAGLVQGATLAVRAKSSLATSGLGNPVISSLELFGATATALLAVFVPVLALVLIGMLVFFVVRKTGRFIGKRKKADHPVSGKEIQAKRTSEKTGTTRQH